MKIAYCMSGCIGGLTGKAGDKSKGSETVLKLSSESFFKNIYCSTGDTIDIFIFSWDTHLSSDYQTIYSPKKIVVQDQLIFDVPIIHEPNRCQSHYSRWYALKKVVELKNDHEKHYGKYDLTILTRLDLFWIKPLNLSLLDPSLINFDQCIYCGMLYGSKTSKEIGDRFIASNSDYIDKISNIYNKLDEYVTTVPMYRRISSHFIIPHHLKIEGIRDKVHFPFMYHEPGYNQKYEDSHCTLVRNKK